MCIRDSSRVASIHGFPGVPAVISELLTLPSRTVDPISREGGLPARRSRPSLAVPMNAIFGALLVAVSAGKDQSLHLYELNPKTGALVQRAKYDLPGSPGSQCVSPDGNTLYVSVRSANSVAAFRIDHGMKTLVPLGITEIGANAAYVATDRTGRTLLWASYSDGVVGSHAIGPVSYTHLTLPTILRV